MSVILRKKELKNRYHWYLDINHNGSREYKYLQIFTPMIVFDQLEEIRHVGNLALDQFPAVDKTIARNVVNSLLDLMAKGVLAKDLEVCNSNSVKQWELIKKQRDLFKELTGS